MLGDSTLVACRAVRGDGNRRLCWLSNLACRLDGGSTPSRGCNFLWLQVWWTPTGDAEQRGGDLRRASCYCISGIVLLLHPRESSLRQTNALNASCSCVTSCFASECTHVWHSRQDTSKSDFVINHSPSKLVFISTSGPLYCSLFFYSYLYSHLCSNLH